MTETSTHQGTVRDVKFRSKKYGTRATSNNPEVSFPLSCSRPAFDLINYLKLWSLDTVPHQPSARTVTLSHFNYLTETMDNSSKRRFALSLNRPPW